MLHSEERVERRKLFLGWQQGRMVKGAGDLGMVPRRRAGGTKVQGRSMMRNNSREIMWGKAIEPFNG